MSTLLLNSKFAAAGFALAKSREATLTALRAAGANWHEQDSVRYSFMVGYLAHRLNPTATTASAKLFEAAEITLNKANAASKQDARRTADEEKAYGAARVAWLGMLRAAGVGTTQTRGGARKARPAAKATTQAAGAKTDTASKGDTATTKREPVTAPAVTRVNDAYLFLREEATRLAHFEKRNAKVLDQKSRDAIALFLEAVKCLPSE